ncbi:Rieske (2Fe-2S) protein [Actinoallomurus rhizosphaericola]|uniref:Rieske (2Fe-2S) protein n=1 Tax=Actinoallomurus rhizosphaericola TaxID=2952536 RepID=UPI002092F536|nr:Rieske (2Fe-2S) protein [Actinoallomurus rhizosphaericola]MCO5999389.1 Rieske (2Fe-2S) protein [Actinoallomurus rhizosphaericola]
MPFDPSAAPAGEEETGTRADTTRRGMLLGVGLVGVAGTLAACGGKSSDDSDGSKQSGSGQGGGGAAAPAGGDGALGKAADVPVGGGKVFKDHKVVVTQPKQGEFEAFSAVCTHRGCTVDSVTGGTINCPCHGSKFKISDGSVANGPADKPLPRKSVKVENGEIKLA